MISEKIGGGVTLINYPNKWTANTEIDLGNGLFGYRATGTITATAGTRKATWIVPARSGVNVVWSFGGYWSSGGSTKQAVVQCNLSGIGADGTVYTSSSLEVQNGGVVMHSLAYTARTDAAYDIWITYTK